MSGYSKARQPSPRFRELPDLMEGFDPADLRRAQQDAVKTRRIRHDPLDAGRVMTTDSLRKPRARCCDQCGKPSEGILMLDPNGKSRCPACMGEDSLARVVKPVTCPTCGQEKS